MGEFEGSATALVGDADCTAAGKDLCAENGVRGYPTIKYGAPGALEDYKGGRDYDSLLEFAKTNLGPTCGPDNLELCDESQKAEIETAMAMSDEDLEAKITEGDDALTKAEEDFKSAVEGLQKQYEQLMKDKDETIASVKGSGLGLLKTVRASRSKSATHDEL